jgi:tetratricopeptide (TPR) repeat protein
VGDLVLTEDENIANERYQMDQLVAAREAAEDVLAANPDSIAGHAVLGMVMRYGEGNLPRSLYHLRHARRLLELRFGPEPLGPESRDWHSRIIEEAAFTCGEMERFQEELDLWDDYDRIYDPDRPGERIWPTMMLRRFDDAREWARRAVASGDGWARQQAMNGMCAVENEAGNRPESYRWCTTHANEYWEMAGYGGVYFCNAGESARGMLRLDEAERYYLEATRRDVEWYANPWMDLAGLFLRNGRLALAAQAVRSMHEYARRRPPHTQQQDQSERNRAVAALLVVAGRPLDALLLTERAVVYPDRRGGQSRSPEADLATNALLDRRALLDAAEVVLERSSTGGLWERVAGSFEAAWLRARAFRSARRVVALLEDQDLLVGLLEAEGHLAMGTPPWLSSDLVDVVGPGPIDAALDVAAERSDLPELRAYLDTYRAVAAADRGDWDRASSLARSAGEGLPQGEALMRARLRLIQALAAVDRGDLEAAAPLFLEVLRTDPTLVRRARVRLPLRIESADDDLSRRTADIVARSPRIDLDDGSPLVLQVVFDGRTSCRVCLAAPGGGDAGCADETLDQGIEVDAAARRCAAAFHERVLGPREDPSLFDPATLDDPAPGRDPLDGLDVR